MPHHLMNPEQINNLFVSSVSTFNIPANVNNFFYKSFDPHNIDCHFNFNNVSESEIISSLISLPSIVPFFIEGNSSHFSSEKFSFLNGKFAFN